MLCMLYVLFRFAIAVVELSVIVRLNAFSSLTAAHSYVINPPFVDHLMR